MQTRPSKVQYERKNHLEVQDALVLLEKSWVATAGACVDVRHLSSGPLKFPRPDRPFSNVKRKENYI
jgi:hypothetical protein